MFLSLVLSVVASVGGGSPSPAFASTPSPLTSHIVRSSNRGLDEGLLILGSSDRSLAMLRRMGFAGTEAMPLATTWPCAITGTLIASVLLSCGQACTPPPPTLETDLANCTQQSWCTSNSEDQCTSSSTCTKGPNCTSTKGCTSAGQCTNRNGCTGTQTCTESTACTQGTDCTAGQYCTDSQNDVCTGGPTCTKGAGCTTGANCTAGAGCTKDSLCTKGASCTKSGNANCTTGATCTKGANCPKTKTAVVADEIGSDSVVVASLDRPGRSAPEDDPHFASSAAGSFSFAWLGTLVIPAVLARRRRVS